LVIWERELGPEHVDLPFVLGPLGEAELGLEQPMDAVVHLKRALRMRSDKVSASELRKLRFALARALWESGQDLPGALQLGALAASTSAPAGDKGGESGRARDRELQDRAVAWLASHRGASRNPGAIVTRLSGTPVLR
jgi:hypothetical protein